MVFVGAYCNTPACEISNRAYSNTPLQIVNEMQNILLSPASSLKRVGPEIEKVIVNLVGKNRIFNLLMHRPTRLERINIMPKLSEVLDNELVIIKAKIEAHTKPANSRQPHKFLCHTPSGYVSLIFFKIFPSQIEKLKIGREVAVLGRLHKLLSENQISHPQEVIDAGLIETLPKTNIVYPLTGAITQRFLRQKIEEALENLGAIYEASPKQDWIDATLLTAQQWPSLVAALHDIHCPLNETAFAPENSARKRLVYDELLAWQLALLLVKQAEEVTKKLPQIAKNYADEFLQHMPFTPTSAQLQTASEIKNDVISSKKMLRLLQGDVGSGKTVLAIYSCLLAFSQGKQSCVIAPITILADQHYAYFQRLLAHLEIKIEILTGKQTKKQKATILQNLREGKIDILISTHAVLQDDVVFKNLALVVIDEQHRFGVMQRLKLVEKGENVDTLLMSATPIPRSLMMGMYGDMDISILGEKPAGRQEIETLVMSEKKNTDVILAVKRALAKQEKVYWLCPAIEESDESELTSAEEKYAELLEIFGEKTVRLIHGKMKESEKEKVMQEFKEPVGAIHESPAALDLGPQILVATTVIEVGVDVPDATIIIIENAENFGLSQLHQLRGRVGRGLKKSYCILLYGKKYGTIGQKRLGIMRESTDGFFIAEEDLKMRGAGELVGTRQSGLPEFKIADLAFDTDLLKIAHKNAQTILSRDPHLTSADSAKFRLLLTLFDYDQCLKIVGGG